MYVCVDRPRHGKYNTITVLKYKLLLLLHPLNGLFFRTTWISRYRKGKTSRDLNDAKDDGVWGFSGISCKQSAPRFRQTTITQFLQAGCS